MCLQSNALELIIKTHPAKSSLTVSTVMSGNFEVDSINNSMLTVDAEESIIKKRNKESISSLCEGDIICFYKGGDGLYALYIGDERIVRLVSETRSDEEGMFIIGGLKYRTATVTEESFWKLGDEMIVVKESKNDEPHTPLQGKAITMNALKYIGDAKHPELFKTCKEFATFCRYGKMRDTRKAYITVIGLVVSTLIVAMIIRMKTHLSSK